MKRKFLLLTGLFITLLYSTAYGQLSLWMVEKIVEFKHPVPNISYQELEKRILFDASSDSIIFDTRLPEEYNVSHLQWAIQVNPDMTNPSFMKEYGSLLRGKKVIFYCSVGYRSSIFLERVQEEVKAAGASSLANLRGGIFRWYNENGEVFDQKGETDKIHPFNKEWGEMINPRDDP